MPSRNRTTTATLYPRSGIRIPVELPARVRWKTRAGSYQHARGITENISGSGLFVAMPKPPRVDTSITVTVILPALVTNVRLELYCRGRVMRRNRPGELKGMGAVIDDYELRPRHSSV